MGRYYTSIVSFVNAIKWTGDNIIEVSSLIGKNYDVVNGTIICNIGDDIYKFDINDWVVKVEDRGVYLSLSDEVFNRHYRICRG